MIAKINTWALFLITLFVITSCGGGPTGSSTSLKFEGVPQGEIVPIEKRDSVLTGMKASEKLNKQTSAEAAQKWWLHIVSTVDYSGCEGYEDEEITQENTYFAFKLSGSFYVKSGKDGTEQKVSTWEWADESKSAITLGKYPDIEFEITALNKDEVVYASLQSEGSCKATTWEQFGEPFTEVEEVDMPVAHDMERSIEMNETLNDYLSADFATSFSIQSQPANGMLTLVDAQSGEFEYTPSQGFVGQDSFTFTGNNQAGSSNTGTVNINVGTESTASNEFSYDGKTYQLGWGFAEDYGVYTEGFRNYDFVLAEKEENPAHQIFLWLESYGEESFDPGTYIYGTDTTVEHNLLYEAEVVFSNADGYDSYEVTDGEVDVHISGDTYTLEFVLILTNGKSLTGSFEYQFTVVSAKERASDTKSTVSRR